MALTISFKATKKAFNDSYARWIIIITSYDKKPPHLKTGVLQYKSLVHFVLHINYRPQLNQNLRDVKIQKNTVRENTENKKDILPLLK